MASQRVHVCMLCLTFGPTPMAGQATGNDVLAWVVSLHKQYRINAGEFEYNDDYLFSGVLALLG